jgi:dATP pyrophosphohydrolase
MGRAPYQVLVFPYRVINKSTQFALFKREGNSVWQGIAGGGEDDEQPLQAAKREAYEEAGIPFDNKYLVLDSLTTMPILAIQSEFIWGNKHIIIPEYSFGVESSNVNIVLSNEHLNYKWLEYNDAINMLRWDSNKTALWELNYRVSNGVYKG